MFRLQRARHSNLGWQRCYGAPVLEAEILSRESASDRILELRQSSSSCCFQGCPLGSTGSPAWLRRQLVWFSAGATGFSSRVSPAANLPQSAALIITPARLDQSLHVPGLALLRCAARRSVATRTTTLSSTNPDMPACCHQATRGDRRKEGDAACLMACCKPWVRWLA